MARHIGIVACSAEGAALCYRTLCAEAPEVRVIGLSGFGDQEHLRAMEQAGAVACLDKDLPTATLIERVRELMGRTGQTKPDRLT